MGLRGQLGAGQSVQEERGPGTVPTHLKPHKIPFLAHTYLYQSLARHPELGKHVFGFEW